MPKQSTPIEIVRGDVVEANLDPAVGAEQKKIRRCVVIQNDVGNKYSPVTIIAPATGAENIKKPFPINVPVPKGSGGFTKDAVILCGQIRAIDKSRIVRKCGQLTSSKMDEVNAALKISLALK